MVLKHFIIKWLKTDDISELINNITQIEITAHARMRLTNKERKINEEQIKEHLKYKIPEKIGLQANGLYALFYEKNKKEFIKIIAVVTGTKIFIVTSHIICKEEIPRLK